MCSEAMMRLWRKYLKPEVGSEYMLLGVYRKVTSDEYRRKHWWVRYQWFYSGWLELQWLLFNLNRVKLEIRIILPLNKDKSFRNAKRAVWIVSPNTSKEMGANWLLSVACGTKLTPNHGGASLSALVVLGWHILIFPAVQKNRIAVKPVRF